MSDVNDQITTAMTNALAAQETPGTTTPTVETPAAPPETPVTPTAINLRDDALITYKVGGQEFTKPWQEVLKTQVLLPGDYTKKTQDLARQRAEFDAQRQQESAAATAWQQERSQVIAALRDPQKVGALYLAALSKAKEAGQSPAQAQATAQAAVQPEQLLAQIDERLNARFNQYQATIEQKTIEQDLDAYLTGLRKGTLVEDLPGVDDYVFGEVAKMQPKTLDETKHYAKLVFEDYTGKVTAKFTADAKARAAGSQKLTNGIEPPGGALVPPTQKSYKNDRDPQRVEDILAFMKQRLAESA